jgi:hypothetical protein
MPSSPVYLARFLSIIAIAQHALILGWIEPIYGTYGFVQPVINKYADSNSFFRLVDLLPALCKVSGWTEGTCLLGISGLYFSIMLSLWFKQFLPFVSIVAWLFHLSLKSSSNLTVYGASEIMNVLFFYLAVGSFFLQNTNSADNRCLSMWTIAMRLHLCIIYCSSGIEKALGTQWWNGEAIWLSSMRDGNLLPMGVLAYVPVVPILGGIAVVALEAGYPMFTFFRKTRIFAVLSMIAMHAAIAVQLQLWIFSLAMVAFNLIAFWHDFANWRILLMPYRYSPTTEKP